MSTIRRRLVRLALVVPVAIAITAGAVAVAISANAVATYTLTAGVAIPGKLWDTDCGNCIPVADRTKFTYTVPDKTRSGLRQWNLVALRSNYASNYDLSYLNPDGTRARTDHGNNGIDYVTWSGHNGTYKFQVDQVRQNGDAWQYHLNAVVSTPYLTSGSETVTFSSRTFARARTIVKPANRAIEVKVTMPTCADRGGNKPTAQVLLDFRVDDTSVTTDVTAKNLNPDNDCTYTYRNTGGVTMDLVLGLVNWTADSMKLTVTFTPRG